MARIIKKIHNIIKEKNRLFSTRLFFKVNSKEKKKKVNAKDLLELDIFDQIEGVVEKIEEKKQEKIKKYDSESLDMLEEILQDSVVGKELESDAEGIILDGTEDLSALDTLSDFADNIEEKKVNNSKNLFFEVLEKSKLKGQKVQSQSLFKEIKKVLKEVEEKLNRKTYKTLKKEKKNSKLFHYFDSVKILIKVHFKNKIAPQLSLQRLGIEIPESQLEVLKRKDVLTGIIAFIILIFIYFINYIPYTEFALKQEELNKLIGKNKTLKDKSTKLKGLLRERQASSKEDEKKFNELKEKFFNNQFKDILSATEYIQEVVKNNGVTINSIGKTETVVENMETATKIKDGKIEVQPTVDMSIIEIIAPYNITGDYFQMEKFLYEIETGKAFLEVKNNPIIFTIAPDGRVNINMNMAAYLDKADLVSTNQNIKMEKNDLSVKRKVLAKGDGSSSGFALESVNVFSIGKTPTVLLKTKSGKKYILKENQEFRYNDNNYRINVEAEVIKIINLSTEETTEIKR